MKKLLLVQLTIALFSAQLFSQNVGIGTNNPQTKLDINGALSARVTSAAGVGGTITIPDNLTLYRLTSSAGGGINSLVLSNPKEGQYLTILNEDDGAATLNGYTIPAGTAASPSVANFINIGGVSAGWKTTADNNSGANAFTSGTGLSWSGNTLNSVWSTNGNDIYNNNTSTKVGIGTNAPAGTLDVEGGNAAANVSGSSIVLQAQNAGAGATTVGGSISMTSGTGTLSPGIIDINSGGTGAVNIANGNSSGTVNVGNGTSSQTVNINTGAGVKTTTIGSTNTTSATTINAGSGGVKVGTLTNGLVKSTAGVLSNGVVATDVPTTHTLSNPTNTITSTVNGVAATAPAVNTVANTSSTNTLSTTVNGVAGTGVNIINSNTLTNPTNTITSTLNGVAATAPAVNTVANTSSTNTLSTTVNGIAGTGVNIINSNADTWTQAGGLTTTVNGVSANITPASGTVANVVGYNSTGAPVYQTIAGVLGNTTHTLTNPTNTITSTVNGVAATSVAVNTVANTSSANTLSTTVNGVAGSTVPIINTNALSLSGTTVTSTVNGIASTGLDIAPAIAAKEPWNVGGGTTPATTNSQNIYQNGKVGVGDFSAAAPTTDLQIGSTTLGTFNGIAMGAAANRDLRIGQDATHNIILAWKYNATVGSAYSILENFGGSNPLALQSSGGNVGIGTTAPLILVDTKLGGVIGTSATSVTQHDVTNQGTKVSFGAVPSNNTAEFAGMRVIVAAGTNSCGNTSDIQFATWECNTSASREVARINGSGNMGIGVTSPTARLDVNGSMRVRGLTTAALVKSDASGNLSNATGSDIPSGSTNYIQNQSAADQAASFRVSGTGVIGAVGGVGSSMFKVGSTATDFSDFRNAAAGGGQLEHVAWANGWNINTMTASKNLYLNRDAPSTSNLYLGRSTFETFIRGTDGFVGIGTTNPTGQLEVRGSTAFDAATRVYITNNANDYGRTNLILTGRFQATNDAWSFGSNARNSIVFAQNASASGVSVGAVGTEQYSMQLEGNSNSLGFLSKTNAAVPVMTLLQNGNVGLSTTSPGAKLHVANTSVSDWTWTALQNSLSLELGTNAAGNVGSIKLNSYTPGQFVFMRPSNGNYHIDATTGQYYFNWDESVRGASNGAIHIADEAGTHTVELNTAGVSWLTGGNVGIGTTAPGVKLEVNGTVKATAAQVTNLAGTGNRIVTADASGNLTTNTTITKTDVLYVRGTGNNNVSNRIVRIGNTEYVNTSARGLTLTIITKATHAVVSNTNYDTYGDPAASTSLAAALNAMTNSQIGILTSYDAWEGAVSVALQTAFSRCGLFKASLTSTAVARRPYAAIFEPSSSSTVQTVSANEIEHTNESQQPFAELRGWLIDGAFAATTQLPTAVVSSVGEVAAFVKETGEVSVIKLSGTGDRPVYADATGVLKTGTDPSTLDIATVGDSRVTFSGTWTTGTGAWGVNRLSNSYAYNTCSGSTTSCLLDYIDLSLVSNQYKSVFVSDLDWSSCGSIKVELSFDGGTTWSTSSRISTFRNYDISAPYTSTIRCIADNLPTGVNVKVRVNTERGRFHFEGFGLSKEVNAKEESTIFPHATNLLNDVSGFPTGSYYFTSQGGTILISASGSGYSGGGLVGFNVLIDGVRYSTPRVYTNEGSSHKAFGTTFSVVNGLAPGLHAVTFTNYNSTSYDFNDYFNCSVLEVPPY